MNSPGGFLSKVLNAGETPPLREVTFFCCIGNMRNLSDLRARNMSLTRLDRFPPSPESGLGMSAGSFSRTAAGNLASRAGVFRKARLSCHPRRPRGSQSGREKGRD